MQATTSNPWHYIPILIPESMKRSQINRIIREATAYFHNNGWFLPPDPRWDVTDFGLGDFENCGLVLVNLAEEAEYCEKLMYARRNQWTPAHCHAKKKEDIIARNGTLIVQIWNGHPGAQAASFQVQVNNRWQTVAHGGELRLRSGERITLVPGVYHAFRPESEACIIGEVSTANDDLHDNFFADANVGRFSAIDEDEPASIKLLGEV